jgi:hypothetical protein
MKAILTIALCLVLPLPGWTQDRSTSRSNPRIDYKPEPLIINL